MSDSEIGARLNTLLVEAGLEPMSSRKAKHFGAYISLFIRWNRKVNLSSVRDEEGMISSHIIESIYVALKLPMGIHTVLDLGSGGGLPGIPIALCRPEIEVTLAESRGKKAAFLMEAIRVLGIGTKVHADRAERLGGVFDCVTLRAVDKMVVAVEVAVRLVKPDGWLALMTTEAGLDRLKEIAGSEFSWREALRLRRSESKVLALGRRLNCPP